MSLLSFLERVKRDGFVCGFGWKPNKKAVQDVIQDAVASAPSEPKLEIGCIARQVLKDLENLNDWTLVGPNDSVDLQFVFKTPSRSYTLRSYKYWSRHVPIKLKEIDSFFFNELETNQISNRLVDFEKMLKNKEEEERLKNEKIILEKLFPNCAPVNLN